MSIILTLIGMTSLAAEPPEAYLFAHMLQEDYGRLYYSVSRDGLHWEMLNGRKRITDDYRGHPDLCRGHDGRFYLIGNYSNQPQITLWVSEDLIAWKRHTAFTPAFENIPHFSRGEHHNGAPKIYYDTPTKQYLITWHTPMKKARKEEPELMWSSMRTLYVTSQTLETFSQPKRLLQQEMATIDTIVRRVGDTCYAIIKDELMPAENWPTGKTIRVCTAPDLFGPYSAPGPAITANFREAPTVIPRPDGKGWYLYCERYPGICYECFTAPTLKGPWNEVALPENAVPEKTRHGAILPIPAATYTALCNAFPEK